MAPAIIAALISLAGNAMNNNAQQNANHESIQDAMGYLGLTADNPDLARAEAEGYAQNMRKSAADIYGTPSEAKAGLYEAIKGIGSVNPYKAGEFQYGKTIKDFYDPAFQLSVNNANDSINSSQALGGNLFSSDTADKIAAQNQVLASGMYKDAAEAMQADKGLEQNIWSGNEAARQQEALSNANLARTRYDVANDMAGNISEADNDYYKALLGLSDDYWQNKTDYYGQLAALQAQDPGESGILDYLFPTKLFK